MDAEKPPVKEPNRSKAPPLSRPIALPPKLSPIFQPRDTVLRYTHRVPQIPANTLACSLRIPAHESFPFLDTPKIKTKSTNLISAPKYEQEVVKSSVSAPVSREASVSSGDYESSKKKQSNPSMLSRSLQRPLSDWRITSVAPPRLKPLKRVYSVGSCNLAGLGAGSSIGVGFTETSNSGIGLTETANSGVGLTEMANSGVGLTETANSGVGLTGTANSGVGLTGTANSGIGPTGTVKSGVNPTETANSGVNPNGTTRLGASTSLKGSGNLGAILTDSENLSASLMGSENLGEIDDIHLKTSPADPKQGPLDRTLKSKVHFEKELDDIHCKTSPRDPKQGPLDWTLESNKQGPSTSGEGYHYSSVEDEDPDYQVIDQEYYMTLGLGKKRTKKYLSMVVELHNKSSMVSAKNTKKLVNRKLEYSDISVRNSTNQKTRIDELLDSHNKSNVVSEKIRKEFGIRKPEYCDISVRNSTNQKLRIDERTNQSDSGNTACGGDAGKSKMSPSFHGRVLKHSKSTLNLASKVMARKHLLRRTESYKFLRKDKFDL